VRRLAVIALAAATVVAGAQAPDVRVRVDATGSYRFTGEGPSLLRYYSVFGRYSTVGLIFYLEPGFRAYVSQKLERISRDADIDPIDEAYVEDEGIWRVGKQYLPFGSGNLLRETGLGVRGDTNLIFEELPMSIAFFDTGEGRQQGVVGRLGTRFGLSFAFGRHFGQNATALTYIRRPEETLGRGRGWKRALGFDFSRRTGNVTISGEALILRDGETLADEDLTVFDIGIRYQPSFQQWLEAGYTRDATRGIGYLRLRGSASLENNLSIEPFLRFRGSRLYDLGVELRVRL